MSDPRPWTYAALFGALWGALELSVGTVLHLARVPLYGLLMVFLGLLCLVTLRRLQPRLGVCLLAGAVAVFLKVFTMGGLRLGPIIGIICESVLVELAFLVLGNRRAAAAAAGVAAFAAAPLQNVLYVWVAAGSEVIEATVAAVGKVLGKLGLAVPSGWQLLGIVLLSAAGTGWLGGLVAWTVSQRVLRRLGRHQP